MKSIFSTTDDETMAFRVRVLPLPFVACDDVLAVGRRRRVASGDVAGCCPP